MENVVLSHKKTQEAAGQLLAQIAQADSVIDAANAGAQARGFVLALEIAGTLQSGDAKNLYVVFEAATEARFKALTSAE